MASTKFNNTSRPSDTIIPNVTSRPFIAWSEKRTDFLIFVQKTALANIHFWDDHACKTVKDSAPQT